MHTEIPKFTIPMKKKGTTNALNLLELLHLDAQLPTGFVIGNQIGVSGAKTSCYSVTSPDGGKFVLKIPNSMSDTTWMDKQIKIMELRNKLLKGYSGNIAIPNIIGIIEPFILETYMGECFSYEISNKIDADKKHELATDLANFISFIHSKTHTLKVSPSEIFQENELRLLFQKCNAYLDRSQKNFLLDTVESYFKRDKSDEFVVLSHSDLRYQNILYDTSTEKMSVIDFENLSYGNIYCDLMLFFKIDYAFWFDMVNMYNETARENGLHVDLKKLKLFHFLLTFCGDMGTVLESKTPDDEIAQNIQKVFRVKQMLFDK